MAIVVSKTLRAATGMEKSAPMPEGSYVWVRLPGSSREVRASVVSYSSDRVVVQYADGTQSVITPEQCRAIDEAMLEDSMGVIGPDSKQYRLIPPPALQPLKAVGTSLLKGVKPFTPVGSLGVNGGDGNMDDAGL